MKKGCHRLVLLILALSLLLLPVVFAAEESLLKAVWKNVVWIFALGWITETTNPLTTFVAFIRFVMAVITFVLVYELLSHFTTRTSTQGPATLHLFSKQAALIISLAIALMSSVFFPVNLLLTIVVMYGTFVAFIMVFVPVFMAIWLSFGFEIRQEDNYLYGVRVVFLIVAIWLLRILAQWAKFTVTSGGMTEFAGFVAESTAERSADFLVKLTTTLTTLTTMADFGTFILVIAILYNLNHWLFPTPPTTTATGTARGILDGIGEAIRGRAEERVESAAQQIRYPSLKHVEKNLNDLVVFFRTLEDDLRAILTAARRPANINREVQRVIDNLNIPVTILNRVQGTQGYTIDVVPANIPASIRTQVNTLLTAIAAGTTDAHLTLATNYGTLSNNLENNLLTTAQNPNRPTRLTFQQQQITLLQNCIILTRALLAQNRLQHRGGPL